jgi:hypothetical protein
MKTMYRLLTTGFLIMTMNNFVSATPSTQIWIPSTDVQGFGVIHLGWDSYIKVKGTEGAVTNGGVTVGILPFSKIGLEVGIDYRDLGIGKDDAGNTSSGVDAHKYPVYLNAKVGVSENAFFKYMPAVAVGFFDAGIHYVAGSQTNYNMTYGLIAKNIWKLGRFSVGYCQGNDVLLVNASDNSKKDAGSLLASWDRALTEINDKLWLAVDYMGSKNSYGALTFGGSYAITPDASFIIGYDIWNDSKSYKPTVTVQIDMNLPAIQDWFKKAEKK